MSDAPNLAYLSLGSNIDPQHNLPAAVKLLAEVGRVSAVSSVWESAPVGFAAQPNFLNAAVLLETVHSAADLRAQAIPHIETALGRVRTANKNGPRTIDIDITLFNRDTLQVGSHHIPDPALLERPFVATPLAELAPDYLHPETGQTLHAIAQRLGTTHMTRRPDVILSPGPA